MRLDIGGVCVVIVPLRAWTGRLGEAVGLGDHSPGTVDLWQIGPAVNLAGSEGAAVGATPPPSWTKSPARETTVPSGATISRLGEKRALKPAGHITSDRSPFAFMSHTRVGSLGLPVSTPVSRAASHTTKTPSFGLFAVGGAV